MLLKRGGGGRVLLKTLYDASYSVVQGVGARRVGDVRRVGRCRGPTRRKSPFLTVVPLIRPIGTQIRERRMEAWCNMETLDKGATHLESHPSKSQSQLHPHQPHNLHVAKFRVRV